MASVVQIPVAIDTPGNDPAYPVLTTDTLGATATNVRRWVMAFPDAATGTATGIVRVPQDYASGGKIKCRFATSATSGTVSVSVASSSQADGATFDTALTAEAFQSITVPGTARLNKDVTFPSSGSLTPTIVAADTLTVRVTRDGAGASATDSCTGVLVLLETVFEYTTT